MATQTAASPTIDTSDQPAWHALDQAEEQRLETGSEGLTAEQVAERQEWFGPNELPEEPPTSPLVLLLHQINNPLIYILIAAALLTMVLQEWMDFAVILVVIVLNTVIGYYQERKAESSVRALSQMVTPHARVIRDGEEHDLLSRDLVPGDLVQLESGVRVPVDIRLISTTALQIQETPLTGESVPVTKGVEQVDVETRLADRMNMVYAGTTVVSGRGTGYVAATGPRTALDKIAQQARGATEAKTPLEQRMARFARFVGVAVVIGAVLVFAIGYVRGQTASEMFLVAVAIAVSAIPEELPVATTIALAVRVRRMAQRNAIIRHLPAVETIGSTTCIASDKTGTLTENRMTVQRIWTPAGEVDLSDTEADPTWRSLPLTISHPMGCGCWRWPAGSPQRSTRSVIPTTSCWWGCRPLSIRPARVSRRRLRTARPPESAPSWSLATMLPPPPSVSNRAWPMLATRR